MKYAKRSGFGETEEGPYPCKYDWEEDCYCQCGQNGVVFSNKGNYKTAFFEAFPKQIEIVIRGEGQTIEEAEKKAWNDYQRIVTCPSHEFERRNYTNGTGVCKHCDYEESGVFEPTTKCCVCDIPTNWTSDKKGKFYCQEHKHMIPDEDKKKWQRNEKLSSQDLLAILCGEDD